MGAYEGLFCRTPDETSKNPKSVQIKRCQSRADVRKDLKSFSQWTVTNLLSVPILKTLKFRKAAPHPQIFMQTESKMKKSSATPNFNNQFDAKDARYKN